MTIIMDGKRTALSSEENIKERVALLLEEKNIIPTLATILVGCLLYTSPSPRDYPGSRMPSSA